MKEKQKVALEAVLSERAYQEQRFPGHTHTPGEYLLLVEKLLVDAKKQWTLHGNNAALHEIRQITAVGFAALEQCGAPKRGEPIVSHDGQEVLGL